VGTAFEKRIVSRLNAQYIFLHRASVDDVLADLHDRLSLAEVVPWQKGGETADERYLEFRGRHNEVVDAIFGKPYLVARTSDIEAEDTSSSANTMVEIRDISTELQVENGVASVREELAELLSYGYDLE
jgi:hypothetical protein